MLSTKCRDSIDLQVCRVKEKNPLYYEYIILLFQNINQTFLFDFKLILGLTADGRSNSPVSMFENTTNSHGPFENSWYVTRHPIVINPLAQLRQPVYVQNVGGTPQRQPGGEFFD